MTTTHEIGHIVGGYFCGAKLIDAELRPWMLPHSFHEPDPWPTITLWAGPVLGIVFPLFIAFAIRMRMVWFVANFCIIANGTYLAVAWWTGDNHLDSTRMLSNGTHPLTLLLYCVLTIGYGYAAFRKNCVDWFDGAGRLKTSRES